MVCFIFTLCALGVFCKYAVSLVHWIGNLETARYKVEGEASPAAIKRLEALVPSAAVLIKIVLCSKFPGNKFRFP